MSDRRQESYAVRLEAAELARSREHPKQQANGDEQRYAGDQYFMSFTKGLPHNPDTGLLHDAKDFVEFRRAIDDGFIDPFSDRVPHGAEIKVKFDPGKSKYICDNETSKDVLNEFRQWEAPTTGVVYELEGPDAQAVTMPPAPPLLDKEGKPNPELIFEMAEVYEMAILRDRPLNMFEEGKADSGITDSFGRLNALTYISDQTGRPRKVNSDTKKLDAQTVFRGSSPGVEVGPYLSQFMLIGNVDRNGEGSVADGKIAYGVIEIDQRVPIAEQKDFMVEMKEYVLVQRGVKPKKIPGFPVQPEEYIRDSATGRTKLRFITTLRDLATYVHFDALYEAYLNACLILLRMETPSDPGFDHLSGVGAAAGNPETRRHAGGFALYGGPHILTLVTEVATRALKAVRFQKFNNHIRLRPEALAARIELERLRFEKKLEPEALASIPTALSSYIGAFNKELYDKGILQAISSGPGKGTYFLPMAFPEGSPMHPAYGAGHATVAGACVTILKAFFDTSAVLAKTSDNKVLFKRYKPGDMPIAFRSPDLDSNGNPMQVNLKEVTDLSKFLTLEGELNKLAANISIARNMAGVHYFSDYYDSLRMGEKIAIGILEEQALTYLTDPFVLSVPTFDGEVVRIGRR
jgi:hypothetical protein